MLNTSVRLESVRLQRYSGFPVAEPRRESGERVFDLWFRDHQIDVREHPLTKSVRVDGVEKVDPFQRDDIEPVEGVENVLTSPQERSVTRLHVPFQLGYACPELCVEALIVSQPKEAVVGDPVQLVTARQASGPTTGTAQQTVDGTGQAQAPGVPKRSRYTPAVSKSPKDKDAPRRLVHVTTVPLTLRFLRHQVSTLRELGWDVHCISSPGPLLDAFAREVGVSVHAVPMARTITPLQDLAAVLRLWRTIRRLKPDIVHAHTPKGGLLGMLAAFFARVPTRVYHLRGLPMVTASGARRRLLRAAERTSCSLAHEVISVATTLRRTALAEGLCSAEKMKVLARGSGQGVDVERFDPDKAKSAGAKLRQELGIPADALVVGFVGRLVGDKGVGELAQAWQKLREEFSEAYLLLVGPEETRDALAESVLGALRADERVHLAGFIDAPDPYYAAMDVVAFPSYREGFPNVPLEAGAMGLPLVVSNIPSCLDAVRENETALVVPVKDADALCSAIASYLADPALRSQHGEAGRRFVSEFFSQHSLTDAILCEYRRLDDPSNRSKRWTTNWYRRFGKRFSDVLCSGSALVVLAVPLAVVSALVRLDSPGPVFFTQERVGRGGRRFLLYKFRTMTNRKREVAHEIRTGDPEVTRIGAALRRYKVDELPQILNVFLGDMSMIGPRPTIAEHLPGFTEVAWRRVDERPGISGLAQIRGGIALTWPERWEYDAIYVEDVSLLGDLRILLQTLPVVLRGEEHYLEHPPKNDAEEPSS